MNVPQKRKISEENTISEDENGTSTDRHAEKKMKVVEENETRRESELYKLPDEILLKILIKGTSLTKIESSCERWGERIHGCPEFWRNACGRLGFSRTTISHSLRQELDAARTPESCSKMWRKVWFDFRQRHCQHCFCPSSFHYELLDVIVCRACTYLELYTGITKTDAYKFFSLKTKMVQKVIEENNIDLTVCSYEAGPKYGIKWPRPVTIYHYAQIVEIARMAFTINDAQNRINRARGKLWKIRDMPAEIKEM